MKRFGFAIRVGGDPEIAGALQAGIEAGTRREITRSSSEAVRRLAMMRHTPEELAEMIEEARVLYGGRRRTPCWARPLLVGYAMLCYGLSQAYHAQDKVLERRA